VRALTHCDLYALDKADLQRVLRDQPRFARSILEVCRTRYNLDLASEQAFGELIAAFVEKAWRLPRAANPWSADCSMSISDVAARRTRFSRASLESYLSLAARTGSAASDSPC
jgi:hypothetical protein